MNWMLIDHGPELLHLRADGQARVVDMRGVFTPGRKVGKAWEELPPAATLAAAQEALA